MEYQYCLGDNIGHATLINQTGSDIDVVNAARVSFGKRIDSISPADIKLIEYLIKNNHGTPLEHNSLTFLVKCPLFVARQWHRHRIGISINEISARYVEVKDEFYIPLEFRAQSKSNRQASIQSEDLDQTKLNKIYSNSISISFDIYKNLIDAGVAREQARAVLPLASYTEFYWTCNLRSLLHFVSLRNHAGAQYEIQKYAESMLEQTKKYFPHTISIYQSI